MNTSVDISVLYIMFLE